MTNQPADGDLGIAIAQIRDAIERTCPPEDSRLADALVNCQIVNDQLAKSAPALAAAAEQLREVNEANVKLQAANKELEKVRHGLAKIYEANEKFHWKLADLIQPGIGGVSPLHFVEEGIKKLQAENEARFQMQADRDTARAECDLLRKCLNKMLVSVRNACTVLGGELFLGQDAKDRMYHVARKTHDYLRKLVDDVDKMMGEVK